MLAYFNTNIKPYNDKLGVLLGIRKIPVRIVENLDKITVQFKENEYVISCNHSGATYGRVDFEEYRSDGETIAKSQFQYNCDKCNKGSVDGREWN